MTFKPTQEQQDILNTFKETRVLKVNAVAGSGKTSTLVLLAKDNIKPSLYVCFNKVIAEEARTKFPAHVECRTTHSLAYAEFGKYLQHKFNYPKGFYKNVAGTSAEVAKYYGINDFTDCRPEIRANTVASLVRTTVNRYQNSADTNIETKHVPYVEIKDLEKNHDNLDVPKLMKEVVRYVGKLWNDRKNPASDVLCNPDTYLKLWQLSKPVLNYDILYFDEAQDSNPAVLDVVKRQTHCKIAYVGDTYQSIYQFRGAVNAMELIDAPTRFLSKSFRYGDIIAEVASMIISGAIDVKGNSSIESSVCSITEPAYTYIFKTNAALLDKAVELIDDGASVYVEADTKGFCKQLESAQALFDRDYKKVKHDNIACFSNWYDLLEAAKEDAELSRVATVVHSGNTQSYILKLQDIVSKDKASILLTTAHKSKGKEWSNVIIADDFGFNTKKDNPLDGLSKADVNLLYVACTRAIHKLQLPKEMESYFYAQR